MGVNDVFESLVWKLSKRMSEVTKRKICCCGISISQSHALLEIGNRGEVSLVDLADALSLDKSTVSRTVDNLLIMGFVNRKTDSENRRYITLSLSQRGKAEHKKIHEVMESFCGQLLSGLPEDKMASALEIFGHIENKLGAMGR